MEASTGSGMNLKKKIIWFFTSCLISGCVGFIAYQQPSKFSFLIDLLATIISILIGISLAISAVLSTRPSIGTSYSINPEEKKRIQTILKKDDHSLLAGQNIIFWFYYLALILAVIFKWVISSFSENPDFIYFVKIISGLFGFISSLALLWSATLPALLQAINLQRKDLE